MTFTLPGAAIVAPFTSGGAARQVDNTQMAVWMTEAEIMIAAVSGGIVVADIPTITVKTESFISAGHAIANDNGLGAVYVRGTSSSAMAIQDDSGAWWGLAGNQSLKAGFFGAVANNLTDCATAFASIPLSLCGKVVDLDGGIYYTSSTPPRHVQIINGVIRHSGIYEEFPANRMRHPLDGANLMELERRPNSHIWPGPIGEMKGSTDETLLVSYVMGYRHEVSPGAPLILTSRSGGGAPDSQRVLWSHKDYEPRGLQGGMISDTTYGVGFLMIGAGNSYPATDGMLFVKTSDGGVTKSEEVMVSALADYYYPHSSSVMANGDLWVFGVRASRYAIAQKRTAAGVWQTPIVVTDYQASPLWSSGNTIGEAYGTFCPGFGWLVNLRDVDGSQPYLYAVTANDDFSTITDLVNADVANGSNPPCVIYWAGNIVYLVSSRTGGAVASRLDEVQYYVVRANDVFAAEGVVGPPIATGTFANLGKVLISYLDIKQLPSGKWAAVGMDMEPPAGSANPSSSRLFMIGGGSFVAAAPHVAMAPRPRFGTLNMGWHHAPRGTTWTDVTTETKTLSGWWHQSASSAYISRVALKGSAWECAHRNLTHRPSYATRIVRASGTTTQQKFRLRGREQIMAWSATNIALGRWFGGVCPTGVDGHRIEFTIHAGSGGSGAPTMGAVIQNTQNTTANRLTLIEAFATIPDLSGVTWGTDPYLEISWIFNATGAVDAWDFGCWFNEGNYLIFPSPANIDAETAELDKIVHQKKVPNGAILAIGQRAGSDNSGFGTLNYKTMVAAPAVTLVPPATFASFSVSGSFALTALAFRAGTESHCSIVMSSTGNWSLFDSKEVKATSDVWLLLDAQ